MATPAFCTASGLSSSISCAGLKLIPPIGATPASGLAVSCVLVLNPSQSTLPSSVWGSSDAGMNEMFPFGSYIPLCKIPRSAWNFSSSVVGAFNCPASFAIWYAVARSTMPPELVLNPYAGLSLSVASCGALGLAIRCVAPSVTFPVRGFV